MKFIGKKWTDVLEVQPDGRIGIAMITGTFSELLFLL
jgi:hypothetical protein